MRTAVIVDEAHVIAPNERGGRLALAPEWPVALQLSEEGGGVRPVRIGFKALTG
ncbi:MAG: hypothetical protein ACRYGA_01820 [Janthinobacterium lividum]